LQNKLYPENYKSYFKEIALKCEVHPDLVEELVRFFYGNIRKNLEELDNTRVLLPNLGTFILRKNRLEKSIKRHKDMLGNMEKTTYSGYGKHLPVKEKLQKLEKANARVDEELLIKKNWKNENR
tara:strand:+ start:37 stop:408 length:372 start_codon:yes stop_codon:yes gene_type:complete